MYWGTLILINTLVPSNLGSKVELFFEKGKWNIKIGQKMYSINGHETKNSLPKKKQIKKNRYIRFKKTSYGTEIIEFRSMINLPWHLAGETRGKIKVIDDSKGIIKIIEDHQTKIQQVKTGKNIMFSCPIKGKILSDEYLILWHKSTENPKVWIYQLPEMELLGTKTLQVNQTKIDLPIITPTEDKRNEAKVKDQSIKPPEEVEL